MSQLAAMSYNDTDDALPSQVDCALVPKKWKEIWTESRSTRVFVILSFLSSDR